MYICNNHSAYFSVGKIIYSGGQLWAMDRFDLMGGQSNLLGGQMPTQLTCYLPPPPLARIQNKIC